jgi:hypothetical protein
VKVEKGTARAERCKMAAARQINTTRAEKERDGDLNGEVLDIVGEVVGRVQEAADPGDVEHLLAVVAHIDEHRDLL